MDPRWGDTPSHLGRFRAVTVGIVIAGRQGELRGWPATAEAVQGATQGAETLPEPELGFAGAAWVVGHALAGPAAAWVKCSRFAEGHEQQTGGQQEEDAGQGNEHGEGVSCLSGAPRGDRSCEEGQGPGALCAHGSCNRNGTETQRQIRWTQGWEGRGTLMVHMASRPFYRLEQ